MTPEKSFTLVELLIVLVIIGILATLTAAQFTKYIERSQVAQALVNLAALRKAELMYYAEKGEYYNSQEWLPAPVPSDGGIESSEWVGTFPADFPVTKSDKLFTYKAMKETAWGAALPGNFHVAAFKRNGPGAGWYYYMDVETGKVYRCCTPYSPGNVHPYL